MDDVDRIFVGTFVFTTDNFLVQLLPEGPFLDVNPVSFFPGFDEQHFGNKMVSILGHMGRRTITGTVTVPSLIAK